MLLPKEPLLVSHFDLFRANINGDWRSVDGDLYRFSLRNEVNKMAAQIDSSRQWQLIGGGSLDEGSVLGVGPAVGGGQGPTVRRCCLVGHIVGGAHLSSGDEAWRYNKKHNLYDPTRYEVDSV